MRGVSTDMWYGSMCKLPVVVPVTFNFMPSWWYQNYGIAYGERVFSDPDYRAEIMREMHRLLYDRFGEVGLGEADPEPAYFCDDLLNSTIPAALGCAVIFEDDMYPRNLPLSEEQVRKLRAPQDLTQRFPMREIVRQARYMSNKTGENIPPTWTFTGLQTTPVLVRGSCFFLDYYAEPELAERLLDLTEAVMLSSLDYFLSNAAHLPRLSGSAIMDMVCNFNCTVDMIGPTGYEQHLLRREMRLYDEVSRRGLYYTIHHCGLFDPYAPLYRRIGSLRWLEIGWGSDLRLALDTFPKATVQYIISHQLMKDASPAEVRDTLGSLLQTVGPDWDRFSLAVSDLEWGTPDENIRVVVETLLPETTVPGYS